MKHINLNKISHIYNSTHIKELTYNDVILYTINKFSTINFKSLYDLIDDKADEYILGYEYFDECFGINIDF